MYYLYNKNITIGHEYLFLKSSIALLKKKDSKKIEETILNPFKLVK